MTNQYKKLMLLAFNGDCDNLISKVNGNNACKKRIFQSIPVEIEASVKQHANAEIEFIKVAEAREYRETLAILEQLNKQINAPKEQGKLAASLI